jgi:hypothetical protein
MTPVTLTASDLQRLKSDHRFTAAHAALLEILLRTGEVVVEAPAVVQPAPQGVRA